MYYVYTLSLTHSPHNANPLNRHVLGEIGSSLKCDPRLLQSAILPFICHDDGTYIFCFRGQKLKIYGGSLLI